MTHRCIGIVMPSSPGIPTGRGSGLKHRPVSVRIRLGAHNADMAFHSKVAATTLGIAMLLGMSGCSSSPEEVQQSDMGNRFETSNPTDGFLDDGSGNELAVGSDLTLPGTWPEGVPTPAGTLIAFSVIDDRTAVATFSVDGDVFSSQQMFLTAFDTSFTVEPIPDLSTDTIAVYGAIGNGYDITISATLGEQPSDRGEITLLVNPSL